MIKVLPRNIVRFIVLVLVQVLVFNNIELGGYINPYVYVLFILLLPFETPGWITLVIAFLLGLSIDLLTGFLGLHTAAVLLMAYLRPYILSLIAPRDGYETGSYPRIFYYGLPWFLKYTVILVLIHHTLLFFLEMFRFQDIWSIFLRILLSAIFSITIIVVSQYFVFRK